MLVSTKTDRVQNSRMPSRTRSIRLKDEKTCPAEMMTEIMRYRGNRSLPDTAEIWGKASWQNTQQHKGGRSTLQTSHERAWQQSQSVASSRLASDDEC